VKWTEEATRQLEVTPFVVNSAFYVRSNSFHILKASESCSLNLMR